MRLVLAIDLEALLFHSQERGFFVIAVVRRCLNTSVKILAKQRLFSGRLRKENRVIGVRLFAPVR
jgi:hypothetical protein